MNGQLMRTLVNKNQAVGEHSLIWNGTDERGKKLDSGIYFYQLKAGDNYSKIRKMLLVK